MKVGVTGGAGRIGTAVVQELLQNGYDVRCIDRRRPEERTGPVRIADLTDMGQTVQALHGLDAVVHLAAIPGAGLLPNSVTFGTNITSHYHVMEAAAVLGIKKVVTASSIQVLTQVAANEAVLPSYFPVDEDHPRIPSNCYGVSKSIGEDINVYFSQQHGIQSVGLRFTWVTSVEQVRKLPADRGSRPDFWSYVDVRDAAQACRLGIEADGLGAEAFFISAADSMREEPTLELLKEHYPGIPIKKDLPGHAACFDISKAKELLGYKPQYTWRNGA